MPDPRRLLALVLAVVAGGCAVVGPIGDKAGGVPGGKVVLRIAVVSSQLQQEHPPVWYFIQRVETLSGGNITISPRYNWQSPHTDAEQQVLKATAAGAVELGVIGSRVFDTMGVRSLQALSAPMLIDSYPLENAVLRSRIAAQMLAGVARLNVVGLALIGNGLRKPVAVARPLLGQRDWRGIGFGDYLSDLQNDTIHALGATPLVAFSGLRNYYLTIGRLKGFEMNVLTYDTNHYSHQAPFITKNVILWPQVDVLIANPGTLAQLTSQQRDWLEQAAREASDRSASMMASNESSVVPALCRLGTRFAEATRADLAWFRRAVAPIYSRLEADPQTRAFLAWIERIKRATPTGSGLAIPEGCLAR